MKTLSFILGMVPSTMGNGPKAVEMNSFTWYALGAFIALLLLGYLIYALIKPEKF